MSTIAFTTLGCRVNQYDTDSMRGLFLSGGFTEAAFDDIADVYVINTCSVTQMGEKKSRQLIRRAKKRNQAAIVVVTGCYAQLAPSILAAMEGVDAVIGTNEKKHIVEIVSKLLKEESKTTVTVVHDIMSEDIFEEIPLYPSAVEHTRADLKIQEGCSNFCTYCIIPYTRGRLKSRQPDAVIVEAHRLLQAGFKAIVLTGIHLGAYGKDLPDTPKLSLILRRLLEETEVPRIRLGSVESLEVDEDLIQIMNSSDRICPHLHLPLQSGSNTILKAMNRHYTTEDYISLVDVLRTVIPGLTVSTDIILGFPGETETLFDETMHTLKRLRFSHIHAFPYSPRRGTPAASMKGQIESQEKKKRVEIINTLSALQKDVLLHSMIGETVRVLIETQEGTRGEGFSENYERVCADGLTEDQRGSIVTVRLEHTDNHILFGTVKEDS